MTVASVQGGYKDAGFSLCVPEGYAAGGDQAVGGERLQGWVVCPAWVAGFRVEGDDDVVGSGEVEGIAIEDGSGFEGGVFVGRARKVEGVGVVFPDGLEILQVGAGDLGGR